MVAGRLRLPRRSPVQELLQPFLATVGATYGRVYLKNATNGALAPAAAWGTGPPDQENTSMAKRVVQGGRMLLEASPLATAKPALAGAAVGVPLGVGGQARGVLLVGFPAGEPVQPQGDRVGVTFLLARLIEEHLQCIELRQTLAEREEHLDQLMRSTIEAQEAEREWICLEVHDGVAQTLASAFQHLQAYEAMPASRLDEARPHVRRTAALLRQAIGECREVINSITPAPLSELGLAATLRQELRHFEEDTGCPVQFDPLKDRLPREMEVVLYRIVHEAVTNVRKHAWAKSLEVQMCREENRVGVRIKDSGVGFDPSVPSPGRGLLSMRKRAEILGGVCEVKSQPGQGTEVIVDVPLFPGREA